MPTPAALVLTLLVLWAPLPFASVTPAGLLVLRLSAFVALALALWDEGARVERRGLSVPLACLLGIAVIGLMQSIPLPVGLVGLLAPERVELAAAAAASAGRQSPAVVPLSLAPSQSLSTALTFLAIAATLWAAARVGGDRRNRRYLLGALLAAAIFQLLYGLRHLAAGADTVWGQEVGRAGPRLRGTFVNPAHLAPYLEMALVVAFALGWWAFRRAHRSQHQLEWRLGVMAAPVLLWLLLFSGLALTRSRTALLVVAVATLAQGVLMAAYHRRWRLVPVGIAVFLAGVAWVSWTGFERGLGRIVGTSVYSVAANIRLEVWKATAELWRRFPATGTGLGSFESTFPMVQTEEMAIVSWQHAHNDWLELLSTGGPLALAAALIGVAFLMRRLYRTLAASHSREAAAAALAGLGAVIAVGLHELLDFGLTLPANSFSLAVLAGVAAAGDRAAESE